MTLTDTRMRSLGWAAVMAICLGLFIGLSLRVHAVKSEVRLAERQIISLERKNRLLETEFQARASQRQLAEWNRVEFGYEAPRADQYLDGERQLANLGQPRGPDAPAPIRVARSQVKLAGVDTGASGDGREEGAVAAAPAMVSPVSGRQVTLASAAAASSRDARGRFADAFGEFLVEASPIKPARAKAVALGKAQGPAE